MSKIQIHRTQIQSQAFFRLYLNRIFWPAQRIRPLPRERRAEGEEAVCYGTNRTAPLAALVAKAA